MHVSGHTDSVEAAKMSHMLALSATVGVDGKLIVWDNATLSVRATCQHPEVSSAALQRSLPTACLVYNVPGCHFVVLACSNPPGAIFNYTIDIIWDTATLSVRATCQYREVRPAPVYYYACPTCTHV